MSPAGPTGRRIPFGAGELELGDDGAVVAVRPTPTAPSFLLGEEPDAAPEAVFHEAAWRWGKGFLITDRGSHRFDRPTRLDQGPDGVSAEYCWPQTSLTVHRQGGASWTESYTLHNEGDRPLVVGSIGVSTPWRDVYFSAEDSLHAAVHAHVWAGGRDAWVWSEPMHGAGPGLGLIVVSGSVEAYSVESRDQFTSSNVRGHLLLHVTDHARSPEAMGGQRPVVVAPGATYGWSWRLDWYDDRAAFHTARRRLRPPLVEPDRLAAPLGEQITLRVADGATVDDEIPLSSSDHGVRTVWASRDGERSRVTVLHHAPLRAVVEARIRFVLDHQRATERDDVRSAAFVPYDNRTGLTVLPGAWRDWSDSRERVGTALLLQQALARGWGDTDELTAALAAYAVFVRTCLVGPDGTVADDSRVGGARLYNYPWFARFLLEEGDLDGATRVLDRYYALDGARFLAFDLGPLLLDVAARLSAVDRAADARRMPTTSAGTRRP